MAQEALQTVEIPVQEGGEEAFLSVHLDSEEEFTGPGQDAYIVSILNAENAPLSLFLTFAIEAYKRRLPTAYNTFLYGGKQYIDAGKGDRKVAAESNRDKVLLLNALANDRLDHVFKENQVALLDQVVNLLNQADPLESRTGDQYQLTRISKAMMMFVRGDYDSALNTLSGFQDHHFPPFNLAMGAIAAKLKKWKEAAKCYQRILQIIPDLKPDPRIPLGICFHRLGFTEIARKAFERALERDPTNINAVTCLAAIDWQEAKKTYHNMDERQEFKKAGRKRIEEAARLDGQHPLVRAFLSIREMEKPLESQSVPKWIGFADQVLSTAKSAGLRADAYYLNGRALHSQANYEKAFEAYKEAMQLNPESLPILRAVGEMYMWKGDETKAIGCFESILEKIPTSIPILHALGSLYSTKKDDRPARKKVHECFNSISKAIIGPNLDEMIRNPLLCVEMAWVKDSPDNTRECEEWYSRALKIVGDDIVHMELNVEVINNAAVKTHVNGKTEEAIDMYQKAVDLCRARVAGPDEEIQAYSITIKYNLARLYEQTGNIEKATSFYEEILEADPEYHDAHLRLGEIAELQQQYDTARQHYNRVVSSDPRNVDSIIMLARHWENLSILHSGRSIKISEEAHKESKSSRDLFQKIIKDSIDRVDPYSLCGAGNVTLSFARTDYKNQQAHIKTAFEYFNKALKVDGLCLYAVMGIANVFAESEHYKEASDIYQQILDTPGVPQPLAIQATLNHAHVLYSLTLYKQAIAKYQSILHNVFKDSNPELNNFIARCYYTMAKRERDPQMMLTALHHIQKANKLNPSDQSYTYNIAMVKQQYASVLNSAPAHKRTVAAMDEALRGLESAKATFANLANMPVADHDGSYDMKLAGQRADYCDKVKKETEKKLHETKTLERERAAKLQHIQEERERRKEQARLAEEEKKAVDLKRQQETEQKLREKNEKVQEENRFLKEQEALEKERKKAGKRKPKKNDGIVEDNDPSDSEDSDQEPKPRAKSVPKKKRKVVQETTPDSDGRDDSDGASESRTNGYDSNEVDEELEDDAAGNNRMGEDGDVRSKKSKSKKSKSRSKEKKKSKSKSAKSSKKRQRDEDGEKLHRRLATSDNEQEDEIDGRPHKKSKSAKSKGKKKQSGLSVEFIDDSEEEGGSAPRKDDDSLDETDTGGRNDNTVSDDPMDED
ncbi:hypothetical protein SeLEV6574_g04678 [Synchytrium endobioticum]|nr:hypothetical protein SeLEV6574_g04678 [Synchytrium endobioticum]